MGYNPNYVPGPGDEETWPKYDGHPNDPRAPEDDDEEEDDVDLSDGGSDI